MSFKTKLEKLEKNIEHLFEEDPTAREFRPLELLHNLLNRRKDPEYLKNVWKRKYRGDIDKITGEIETYLRSLAEGK